MLVLDTLKAKAHSRGHKQRENEVIGLAIWLVSAAVVCWFVYMAVMVAFWLIGVIFDL